MTIVFKNGDTIKTNLNLVFHDTEYTANVLTRPEKGRNGIITIRLKDIKRIEP